MSIADEIRTTMKAALWEDAKGKLRALVAVQGSYSGEEENNVERWKGLSEKVEAFIQDVEDFALQE